MLLALFLFACWTPTTDVPPPAEAPPAAEAPADAPAPPAPMGKRSPEDGAACADAIAAVRKLREEQGEHREQLTAAAAEAKAMCLGVHTDDTRWLDELLAELGAPPTP